jgi:hypothetical protein
MSVSAAKTLQAPSEDGAVVAEPPLDTVGAVLALNRQRLERSQPHFGRAWSELRQEARRAALVEARAYLERLGEPAPPVGSGHLLMAGHQPDLFHPGVWVKNFALHGLAHKHGLTALNLVVDNDTVKTTGLRLPVPPSQSHPWPHATTLSFDRWTGEAPYEERTIQDAALFADFADRAMAVLQGWGYSPLLPAFWEEVRRAAAHPSLLGDCFAIARRTFERRWGCHNLEVPVSALCRTEPFAWFACHLLRDLPRFHGVYNECVHAYRVAHGLRSRNHPVPDLVQDEEWFETPFWGWRSGQTRRGRLFARALSDRIELRAGADAWPPLPLGSTSQAPQTVRAWLALETAGFKVRSRALTNTLYARLFLADLFIHGIGGGKYDELTDEILRRFYHIEPPVFLVLSATRLLPLPAAPVQQGDRRQLARRLRDLEWNPQRHLDRADSAALRSVIAEKQAWIERKPTDAAGRRRRYEALRALTARLRAPLHAQEQQLREELRHCDQQLEANAVVRRRDYSFCLYPEEMLRAFCTQFL